MTAIRDWLYVRWGWRIQEKRHGRNRWTVRLEWKVEDAWVGVFWRRSLHHRSQHMADHVLDVWVCIVPCVPIHITRAW